MKIFLLALIQSLSFTLMARARTSGSLPYHAAASVISSTTWLIVSREALLKANTVMLGVCYVAGNLVGGLLTHHWLMKMEKQK